MASDPDSSDTTWVAGVDGCPAGWITVLLPIVRGPLSQRNLPAPNLQPRVLAAATFADILALPENPVRIAVDMPIGLADRIGPGGRQCDIEARRRLGQRQSSVFTVPARAAVMETDYRDACSLALAHSDPPRQVSKQCFNLFPKIREIDRLMTPQLQARVFECHPEVAFSIMNGEQPLDEPKKVKSRPYGPGLALRRRLLAAAGMPPQLLEERLTLPRGSASDDLLDALACAWSAYRNLLHADICMPPDPPRDSKGLKMEIRG